MSNTVKERVSALVDPEYHFQCLADNLRKKLVEVNEARKECDKYGLVVSFYNLSTNETRSTLPTTVLVERKAVY